jgi:hypothetical protein
MHQCSGLGSHDRQRALGSRLQGLCLEYCPNCGVELKTIAAIPDKGTIDKIVTHRGVEARSSPRMPLHRQMGFEEISETQDV